MRTLFQLALCICMIILTGGSIAFVMNDNDQTFGGGVVLILVWAVMYKILESARIFEKSGQPDPVKQEWSERITTLEKRLTDIQDVVIAIDDKLTRQEFRDMPSKEKA